MLRFKTVNYLDKACTGIEAFSMLLPEGWSFEGGIQWTVDNTMMPATCGFKVAENGVEMQLLPGQAFFWTSLPHVRLSHPAGSRYLGATVCPPVNASEFLTLIMLPALRSGIDDLSIVRKSPAVDLGSTLGFEATFEHCGSSSSSGAGIRVKYVQNDRHYEEELYCTVTTFTYTIPVGSTSIDCLFWMADHLFSFRTETGRLDTMKEILQAIVYSLRINPRWMEKNNRIGLFLKDRQMRKPYSLRQLGADTSLESISCDDGMRTSALRQSAYRWIADNLCGAGSTGEYYDPIQQICVWLPAGYDSAWASDTGEYLLSDRGDPVSDSGFADTWKQMELISPELPVKESSATSATCA